MAWWQIAVIVALVVIVLAALIAISAATAYQIGRERGEEKADAIIADPARQSLFGANIPVRAAERGLVDTMPDAIIVCDHTGKVRYVSPGAQQFALVLRGRIASDEISDILSLVVADGKVREREISMPVDYPDRSNSPEPNGRGLQPGQEVPSNTLYLRVRVGRVVDDLYAVFLKDMSDQRRFETMRRDFVTNVSHELKTPAGAIALLAETITDAADDPDAVRYFSGRVAKESSRLTELVRRLIDLQKAQSMEGVVDMKPVRVMDVVRDAIGENQPQAQARHIDIRLTSNGVSVPLEFSGIADGGMCPEAGDAAADGDGTASDDALSDMVVMADAESLKTAVKNLVENAIHYSPEHTVVAVGVARKDGKVTIRVVDQGIGIPPESLGRIFERFYRVDPARSRETGGSGLGLAITKHCVQECGGTISVWSREGEGSTFTIELPDAVNRGGGVGQGIAEDVERSDDAPKNV